MADNTEYAIREAPAMTDTATSCIIGPPVELQPIIYSILNKADKVWALSGWDYAFYCRQTDNLPSFELLYGGYWMEVLPKDYVIEISPNVCSICIRS